MLDLLYIGFDDKLAEANTAPENSMVVAQPPRPKTKMTEVVAAAQMWRRNEDFMFGAEFTHGGDTPISFRTLRAPSVGGAEGRRGILDNTSSLGPNA